ncbi:LPXTG cell wall anchor domain-containing protein, partial [Planococcus sp. CAU13]|uniref:LPXTG cell wall anchor domain-containing protein n=1 Tax=Planococcus sp. CAU13 TaxID=1541197 RepID=UPI00052FF0C1
EETPEGDGLLPGNDGNGTNGDNDGNFGLSGSGDGNNDSARGSLTAVVASAGGDSSRPTASAFASPTAALMDSGNDMGASLPKTGGPLNSMVFILMALVLLAGGISIRRFA